jgi:hypothetical protein
MYSSEYLRNIALHTRAGNILGENGVLLKEYPARIKK